MDARDQVVARDRLPQRVEQPVAVGVLRPRRQQHLNESWVATDAVDLARRGGRELAGHDDRPAQAWLLVQPLGDLPIVDGAGERHRRIGIVQTVDGVQAIEHRVLHVGRIKHLLLDQRQARAWGNLVGRPAARTRGDWRVGRVVGLSGSLEERIGDVLDPILRQVGKECLRVRDFVVHISVDHVVTPPVQA